MTKVQSIGKPARRVDALEKVLGTAKYLGDYKLPAMLYARALRSEQPHAKIRSLDVKPALAVPGVQAVVTGDDFVDHGLYGFPTKDKYMLAYQKVRYVGEAIAAVAAETPEAALEGIRAIRCELDPLPLLLDMDHALDPDAPQVGPERGDGQHPNFLDLSKVRLGEPLSILETCAVTLDQEYRTDHQEHAYLETEGALAIPTPEKGILVYCSNQSPFINRGYLAMVLGLPLDQVRVIQPPVGGSFGGKDDLNYETSAQVAALAIKTGRPVQMTFSRDESMVASYKRDAMHMRVRLGADSGGTLRACKFEGTLDSGAYASQSPFTGWRASIHAMGPYRYEACDVDITGVYTNNGFSGAFRGFGNPEVTFAIEQAIDEMADRLGLDPIDFRLKNCLRAGDETPHGQRLTEAVGLTECLKKVRQMSDWVRKRRDFPAQNAASAIRKGIGVAAFFHGLSMGAEGEDSASSTIKIEDTDTITLTSGLTDYGTGSRTVFTLIAAEELGVRPERIQMLRPDTNTSIDSGATVASRSTIVGGNATGAAARSLAQMLDLAAANLFACQPSQLSRDGEAYVGPDEKPVAWEQVVEHARRMGLVLSAQSRWSSPAIHWDSKTGRGMPYIDFHYGAQVVEVAVDMGTGKTDVSGVWAAHDAGKILFPQGAYGQVYGGITQGLGYALLEQVIFDRGYLQATNYDEYLIPTAMDVPDIQAAFIDTHSSIGPFGAKNIGEPALVPAAPAALNAIAHATGKRIRELPANLERVLLGHDLQRPGGTTSCKLGLHIRSIG
ncbi:MAG: xanthine dehydrogenase family protein molybdopterin-binding subunit [Anaerolineales bacterium]|jgi:CO/xanthine dehydrogenase Mo-binding subunit